MAKKDSELDAIQPLSAADIIAITQDIGGGVLETRKGTLAELAIYFGGAGAPAAVVNESGTSLTAVDADAGKFTRFTGVAEKTYTFTSAETYIVGAEFNGRNIGAGDLTLTEGGSFVLNAPAGGTLVIPAGGTFTVKIVGAAEADVFGVTVPA